MQQQFPNASACSQNGNTSQRLQTRIQQRHARAYSEYWRFRKSQEVSQIVPRYHVYQAACTCKKPGARVHAVRVFVPSRKGDSTSVGGQSRQRISLTLVGEVHIRRLFPCTCKVKLFYVCVLIYLTWFYRLLDFCPRRPQPNSRLLIPDPVMPSCPSFPPLDLLLWIRTPLAFENAPDGFR
jgi:hypothetical protein